jgi:hypothetical protein
MAGHVDFDWTPKSTAITYTIGGNTYPPTRQADNVVRASDSRYQAFYTTTNAPLTFTATVVAPTSVPTEYRWNFGDGSIGYGQTVTHTYTAGAPQTQVTLAVTLSDGSVLSRSRTLNLVQGERIVVHGMHIRMAGGSSTAPLAPSTGLTTNTTRVTQG